MDVRLVVANGIDLTQFFGISKNSAIRVWSGGTSLTLNDNQIVNQPGNPSAFILYCTPTVTSFRLNSGGLFTGVIVAPGADFTLFNGNRDTDFCGALFMNSVFSSGHAHFHFDEALNQVPP